MKQTDNALSKATWESVGRTIAKLNSEPRKQGKEVPPLPDLDLPEKHQGCTVILVEISGGLAQDVSLLNEADHPIQVIVRDHDSYDDDPEGYQDGYWYFPASQGRQS